MFSRGGGAKGTQAIAKTRRDLLPVARLPVSAFSGFEAGVSSVDCRQAEIGISEINDGRGIARGLQESSVLADLHGREALALPVGSPVDEACAGYPATFGARVEPSATCDRVEETQRAGAADRCAGLREGAH